MGENVQIVVVLFFGVPGVGAFPADASQYALMGGPFADVIRGAGPPACTIHKPMVGVSRYPTDTISLK